MFLVFILCSLQPLWNNQDIIHKERLQFSLEKHIFLPFMKQCAAHISTVKCYTDFMDHMNSCIKCVSTSLDMYLLTAPWTPASEDIESEGERSVCPCMSPSPWDSKDFLVVTLGIFNLLQTQLSFTFKTKSLAGTHTHTHKRKQAGTQTCTSTHTTHTHLISELLMIMCSRVIDSAPACQWGEGDKRKEIHYL